MEEMSVWRRLHDQWVLLRYKFFGHEFVECFAGDGGKVVRRIVRARRVTRDSSRAWLVNVPGCGYVWLPTSGVIETWAPNPIFRSLDGKIYWKPLTPGVAKFKELAWV